MSLCLEFQNNKNKKQFMEMWKLYITEADDSILGFAFVF